MFELLWEAVNPVWSFIGDEIIRSVFMGAGAIAFARAMTRTLTRAAVDSSSWYIVAKALHAFINITRLINLSKFRRKKIIVSNIPPADARNALTER